ncbi:MAG TPA: glycerophosphodiester phosphodiesterase family protein [Ktedonobacterales bacterium]|jgi:glycerophosphoryl diester phosphodiesterase
MASDTLELVAHRGGAALAPENTLAAFQNALTVGVDAVEMDVHLTRDGEVVVFHDNVLDNKTDGHGNIADATWAELQTLNAAAKYPNGWSERAPISSLAEVVQILKGKVRVQIEIKRMQRDGQHSRYPQIEARVVDILRAAGVLNQVLIISYDWGCLTAVKTLEPRLLVGTIVAPESLALLPIPNQMTPFALIQTIRNLQADYLNIESNLVTKYLVDRAHASGLKVGVWTVNEPAMMLRLAALGIDSITSDRPDLLVKTFRDGSR